MDVAALIKDIGFPIAACVWLAFRVERKLDALQEGQRAFSVAVKLFAAMQGIDMDESEKETK